MVYLRMNCQSLSVLCMPFHAVTAVGHKKKISPKVLFTGIFTISIKVLTATLKLHAELINILV